MRGLPKGARGNLKKVRSLGNIAFKPSSIVRNEIATPDRFSGEARNDRKDEPSQWIGLAMRARLRRARNLVFRPHKLCHCQGPP